MALALCMVLSLSVPALAADGEAATSIDDVSVSYGTSAWEMDDSGNLEVTASNNSEVTGFDVEVTLAAGAAFTPTGHTSGDLYVESATTDAATLKFDIELDVVDINDDMFALNLTSSDGSVWTGGFTEAESLTVGVLASYLAGQVITIPVGALGAGSAAQTIVVNRDDADSTLLLLAPGTTVYTVNYVVDGQTITWLLPAGADLETPCVELSEGESVTWYTDPGFNNALADNATVTGNTTLYANITGSTTTPTDDFYTALTSHQPATIEDLDDWKIFVQYADQAVAGQLITLGDNINCNGATYDSITFNGNFNGAGFAISDANFRAVSTSSGDTCSGMFAKIGHGQVIANLTLDNVTAQYSSTYAGVLVGMADGYNSDHAIIQNVQVRNSSASGRSAGGVAGFIRNATVRYCSSRDTTITGLANGGGIVGLSNAKVEYCYSTTSPTALPSFIGGSAGGVVGKNVRGAYTEYCWSTMTVVGGSGAGTEAGGTDIGAFDNVSNSTTIRDFTLAGFTQDCWVRAAGTATDFNTSVVTYPFTVAD